MKKISRLITTFVTVSLLTVWSVPSFAADSAFKEIFEDSLYGGLTGSIVGAAFMAFTNKPGDHLDYIYVGAAGGVLLGATYGVMKTARSFAEVENGKVRFAVPTLLPDLQESRRGTSLVVKAELVRGMF